jgi:hypothetical protein
MANGSRIVHPNALPNYQNAVISRGKLLGYALNLAHKQGRNKAVVFKSALGFDQSNWDALEQRIREEMPYHEAVLKKDFEYGALYELILPITGMNNRTVDVLTAWIIRNGTDFPFLVSIYVHIQ